MSNLTAQVRRTRQRLWMNRWFVLLAWATTASVGVFAIVVFLTRMFGWPTPLGWIALGLLGAGVLLATILATIRPADDVAAAAALDEAAGLKERVSSGLYCRASEDPYARAVVADAERISGSLSVRQHIPLKAPKPLWYAGTAAVAAGVLLLTPSGWIGQKEAKADVQQRDLIERQSVQVKKQIDLVKKEVKVNEAVKDNPALKDLVAGLEQLTKDPAANPDAQRHEAIKKIDKAADALRRQQSDGKFDKVGEMKKMLRGLKTEADKDSPTQKLSDALAKGDFKAANEAVKAMQQELAAMKDSPNSEAAKKLQEQLSELSKQLDKAAAGEQLRKQLEQSGVKPQDVQKMMEQAAKGDMSEIAKQLAKQGLNQSQMDSLMKQLQKQAGACSACRNMSQALKQAAGSMQQGQMSDAASGLQSAGDELSAAETLEQEMKQLESTMTSLQEAKDGMNPCTACNGTGMKNGRPCTGCQGSGTKEGNGGGMGKLGRGRGGLAPEQEANVAFKVERGKAHTGAGKIIGQFLIEGEQVKGEASSELAEILSAEERNATDAINRDRVPRQYQRSVKEYFTRVKGAMGAGSSGSGDNTKTEPTSGQDAAGTGKPEP